MYDANDFTRGPWLSLRMTRAIEPRLWRACRRWCGSRVAEIEVHRRRFFRARLRIEEWPRRETEHAGEKIRWETAHRRVVGLHRFIEISALN